MGTACSAWLIIMTTHVIVAIRYIHAKIRLISTHSLTAACSAILIMVNNMNTAEPGCTQTLDKYSY